MGNLIVGLGFAVIIFFAGKKAYADLKKGKCSGCSGCGSDEKSTCQIKL
jgi:hypothetical protein